jgi:hypothetical protein
VAVKLELKKLYVNIISALECAVCEVKLHFMDVCFFKVNFFKLRFCQAIFLFFNSGVAITRITHPFLNV